MREKESKTERGIRKGLIDPSTRTTGKMKFTEKGKRRENTKNILKNTIGSAIGGTIGNIVGGAVNKKYYENKYGAGSATGNKLMQGNKSTAKGTGTFVGSLLGGATAAVLNNGKPKKRK